MTCDNAERASDGELTVGVEEEQREESEHDPMYEIGVSDDDQPHKKSKLAERSANDITHMSSRTESLRSRSLLIVPKSAKVRPKPKRSGYSLLIAGRFGSIWKLWSGQ